MTNIAPAQTNTILNEFETGVRKRPIDCYDALPLFLKIENPEFWDSIFSQLFQGIAENVRKLNISSIEVYTGDYYKGTDFHIKVQKVEESVVITISDPSTDPDVFQERDEQAKTSSANINNSTSQNAVDYLLKTEITGGPEAYNFLTYLNPKLIIDRISGLNFRKIRLIPILSLSKNLNEQFRSKEA